MDKRLGVYICGGCSIGESLNLEQLAKVASGEYKVPVCRIHPYLCGAEGLALIRADLEAGAVNALVVAACSPRVKTDCFAFDSGVVFDRISLREQVAWCQKPKDEDAQTAARPRRWSRWSRSLILSPRSFWWWAVA
jgi:quinone-modifying oxidoreductase subunit QmoB